MVICSRAITDGASAVHRSDAIVNSVSVGNLSHTQTLTRVLTSTSWHSVGGCIRLSTCSQHRAANCLPPSLQPPCHRPSGAWSAQEVTVTMFDVIPMELQAVLEKVLGVGIAL